MLIKSDSVVVCLDSSDTEITRGSDIRRRIQFSLKSAKELMRKDTDGDDNEINYSINY